MPTQKKRVNRRRSSKRRGGFLENVRARTKTYCCDSKSSSLNPNIHDNAGTGCRPSTTGQCNPGYAIGQNYKFRCFDVDPKSQQPEIKEGDERKCEYVSGSLSKIARPGMGVVKSAAVVAKGAIQGIADTPRYMLYSGGRKNKKSSKRRTKRSL